MIPGFYYRINHNTNENQYMLNWDITIPVYSKGLIENWIDGVDEKHILSAFMEIQVISENYDFEYYDNNYLMGIQDSFSIYNEWGFLFIMLTTEAACTMTEDYEFGPTIGGGVSFHCWAMNISVMARETYINEEWITDLGMNFTVLLGWGFNNWPPFK